MSASMSVFLSVNSTKYETYSHDDFVSFYSSFFSFSLVVLCISLSDCQSKVNIYLSSCLSTVLYLCTLNCLSYESISLHVCLPTVSNSLSSCLSTVYFHYLSECFPVYCIYISV